MNAGNKRTPPAIPAIGLVRKQQLDNLLYDVQQMTARGERDFKTVVDMLTSIVDGRVAALDLDTGGLTADLNLTDLRPLMADLLLGIRGPLPQAEGAWLDQFLKAQFTHEMLERMLLAVDRLDDRRAIVMRWGLDGQGKKTYGEIDRLSGWTGGTAARKVSRAISQIRKFVWNAYPESRTPPNAPNATNW